MSRFPPDDPAARREGVPACRAPEGASLDSTSGPASLDWEPSGWEPSGWEGPMPSLGETSFTTSVPNDNGGAVGVGPMSPEYRQGSPVVPVGHTRSSPHAPTPTTESPPVIHTTATAQADHRGRARVSPGEGPPRRFAGASHVEGAVGSRSDKERSGPTRRSAQPTRQRWRARRFGRCGRGVCPGEAALGQRPRRATGGTPARSARP